MGQYSLVVFDECQWHTKQQVMYLFSRIRSKARGPHILAATCNPLNSSFLLEFVRWYLDEASGIPIPERSGVTRYFAEYRGDLVFGDTPEEIKERYSQTLKPQTYTFISANIYSNPILMARDPGYVQRLENLKKSERARLLEGSWFAREEAAKLFDRSWVTMVDYPNPDATKRVSSFDLGSSIPSSVAPDPDYTCRVLMSRDKNGVYTIEDAYRFRKLSGDVISEITKIAFLDGIDEVEQTIPGETGSGKSWTQHLVRVLAENGIPVKVMQISGHRGKLQRFLPFASLAEGGCVKVVKAPWNDWFFNELESFDGTRNGCHDDAVDCVSDAFNRLSRTQSVPIVSFGGCTRSSVIQS